MSPAIVVVVVDIVSRNTACREMHQLFDGVTVNGARWTDSSEWGLSG